MVQIGEAGEYTVTLSYVNTREHTEYLDCLFNTFEEITLWVADTFPEHTSYQVLVSRKAKP